MDKDGQKKKDELNKRALHASEQGDWEEALEYAEAALRLDWTTFKNWLELSGRTAKKARNLSALIS